MKLLLDQGLPRSAAAMLRKNGFVAVHVGELEMSAASDEEIIEWARANGHCVFTLDADFHSLLAVSNATEPSVIRLRIQRLKAEAATQLILRVIAQIGDEIERGCFVTVMPATIRIRRLPVKG